MYLSISNAHDLHHGADGLAVSENLAECLRAEDVTQRRLSQQLGRPGRVLDVDHRDPRVRDAVVDHGIHGNRHRILRQDLDIHPTRISYTDWLRSP